MKLLIEEDVAKTLKDKYNLPLITLETNLAPEEDSPKMMTYEAAKKIFPTLAIDGGLEGSSNHPYHSKVEIYCHNNKYYIYFASPEENFPKISFYFDLHSVTLIDDYETMIFSSYEALEEQVINLLGLEA